MDRMGTGCSCFNKGRAQLQLQINFFSPYNKFKELFEPPRFDTFNMLGCVWSSGYDKVIDLDGMGFNASNMKFLNIICANYIKYKMYNN